MRFKLINLLYIPIWVFNIMSFIISETISALGKVSKAKEMDWVEEIARYHQNNQMNNEEPNGKREVVFYSDGKNINNTDEDMGTDNFASPKTNPIGHFFADYIPYLFWGNNENDKSSLWRRLFGR